MDDKNLKEDKEDLVSEEEDLEQAPHKDAETNQRIAFSSTNYYNPPQKKKSKKWFIATVILLVILGAGFFFRPKILGVLQKTGLQATPTPTPSPIPLPIPTPNPLIRSEWSLEVLNGSGETGLAKKIAVKLQDLGYPIVKTGNADKSNYTQTQILVKKDLLDKVDMVIADMKDAIKIASVAGELKEGTASARIIIGKDSI